MRRAILEAPHLAYDTYLRTRSDEELMKRCEMLMKGMKKEQADQSVKKDAVRRELEKEQAALLAELDGVQERAESLQKELDVERSEMAALKKSLHGKKARQGKQSRKQELHTEVKEMTLRGLQLSEDVVLQLVPLLELLRRSVKGRLSDVHAYALRMLAGLQRTVVRNVVALVAQKNTAKGTVGLREELVDKEKMCVDLSKEMEVSSRVREECERASKEPEWETVDVRELNRKEEERMKDMWDKVLQKMNDKGSIADSVLFSQITKEELQCDDNDLRMLAKKYLRRKGGVWILKPERKSTKRPAEEASTESKKRNV